MAKKPTDADEEPIPHQWGESYKAMKQMLNPPGRPKAPPPPAEPVARPVPKSSPSVIASMAESAKRAQREGTESLLQKDQRMAREKATQLPQRRRRK